MGKFTSLTSIEPIIPFYVYFSTGMFSEKTAHFLRALRCQRAWSSQWTRIFWALPCASGPLCIVPAAFQSWRNWGGPLSQSSQFTQAKPPAKALRRNPRGCTQSPRSDVWRGRGFECSLCHISLTWPPDPGHASTSANLNFPFHGMGIKIPTVK